VYCTDETHNELAKDDGHCVVEKEMKATGSRIFRVSPVGDDGRLPWHISEVITTNAAGLLCLPGSKLEGAPPPFIIVSKSSTVEELDTFTSSNQF
jgi:hypothetical protein